jgi:hypothetical protein
MCSRPVPNDKVPKINSKGIIHLGPIHVDKAKKGEYGVYGPDAPATYDRRFVLHSLGETYIGESVDNLGTE